jgi:hypothetical protein
MPRGYTALVTTLQHGMRGDQGAPLKICTSLARCAEWERFFVPDVKTMGVRAPLPGGGL